MKLYLFEIRTKKKRLQLQVVVYAKTEARARLHLRLKHPGHEVLRCIELPEDTRHFVLAELEDAGDEAPPPRRAGRAGASGS